MNNEGVKPAVLDDESLQSVRTLEQSLGGNVVVVAYDRPLEYARLDPAQLEKLTSVEQRLPQTYLVAYRKP
jgi:hypothetical protein